LGKDIADFFAQYLSERKTEIAGEL